jgi:hypothetical protein
MGLVARSVPPGRRPLGVGMQRESGEVGQALRLVVGHEGERVVGLLDAAGWRHRARAVEHGEQRERAVVVGRAQHGREGRARVHHERERLRHRAGDDRRVHVGRGTVVGDDRPWWPSRAGSRGPQREDAAARPHIERTRQLLGQRVHAAGDAVAGVAVRGRPEAAAPFDDQPRQLPLVHAGGECLRADREELGAVVHGGAADPSGRQPTPRRTPFVEEHHVVPAGGEVAPGDEAGETGADDADAHQAAACSLTTRCRNSRTTRL